MSLYVSGQWLFEQQRAMALDYLNTVERRTHQDPEQSPAERFPFLPEHIFVRLKWSGVPEERAAAIAVSDAPLQYHAGTPLRQENMPRQKAAKASRGRGAKR
jgi:hypothetical protein